MSECVSQRLYCPLVEGQSLLPIVPLSHATLYVLIHFFTQTNAMKFYQPVSDLVAKKCLESSLLGSGQFQFFSFFGWVPTKDLYEQFEELH